MSKPILIMMVGLSGSGKSTIAASLKKRYHAQIVSSDQIRKEIFGDVSDQSMNSLVFDIYADRIRRYLLAGDNVIADATNLTIAARRNTLDKCKEYASRTICYIIPKKIENCIRDNFLRPNPVPIEVVLKQMEKFEIPFKGEGFDEIKLHSFKGDKRLPFAEYKDFINESKLKEHSYEVAAKIVEHKELDTKTLNILTMAGFVHEIGKLWTNKNYKNVGSYHLLSNLKCGKTDLLKVCFIVNYHSREDFERYKTVFGKENEQLLSLFDEATRVC